MATQYFCRGGERRALVRAATGPGGEPLLNGIDYLEVASADQRTLELRFIHPLPGEAGAVPPAPAPALTRDNVQIVGGVRITGVRVESAATAENVLTLTTDRAGDFSLYTLRLVTSPTEPAPPAGFDPQLAEVSFSFKVDCPTGFDCAPADECLPERPEEPLIDYLARDYASFRRLMLDRMAVLLPGWRERNPADVGVVLVEALAYAADHLSYYQDAVATEAYLGTARRRVSVRRHARLLDYPMHDGCNARAWLCLEVAGGPGTAVVLTPEGISPGRRTRFLTRSGAVPAVVDPSDLEEVLSRWAPEVFEPLHPAVLYPAHNQIRFYTWGASECCLPRGATRATLRDDAADRLKLRAGDVLLFEQVVNAEAPGAQPDPAARQAVRLTRVRPEATLTAGGPDPRAPAAALADPLTGELYVEVEWSAADALAFPLCISTEVDGVLFDDVSVARGNVVLADHGRTIEGETHLLDPGPAPARVTLARTDVTQRVPATPGQLAATPAARAAEQDPREALAAVQLRVGDDPIPWTPVRDLLDSDAFDRNFVVEVEEDGSAMLRFGDGTLARRPEGVVRAAYRVGVGQAGNVGAETVAHVVTDLSGIAGVRNPLPAAGGTPPEPAEQVRLYAPQAFRTQERAVTEADYAEIAQRHPEVQRAHATLRWTGSWHTMFVTVDRVGGRPVDADFEEELLGFIQRYRLAGHDVEIEPPRFVPLDIALTVCVEPGYFPAAVKAELVKLFSAADLPGGRRGFFHPDNFTFGQPLYLSRVVAAAMGVPGVRSVDVDDTPPKPNRFRRWGEPSHGELAAGRIEVGRLEIVRLDNDPNDPENGQIRFYTEGGR